MRGICMSGRWDFGRLLGQSAQPFTACETRARGRLQAGVADAPDALRIGPSQRRLRNPADGPRHYRRCRGIAGNIDFRRGTARRGLSGAHASRGLPGPAELHSQTRADSGLGLAALCGRAGGSRCPSIVA